MMSLSSAQSWLLSKREGHGSEISNRVKRAVTVSVTSGKGGVGKTSISLLMARIIANMGLKVLIVDCDFNLSNSLVKLGMPLNDNFHSLLNGEKLFDDCLIKDRNFHLLAGCNGNLNLASSDFKLDQIVLNIVADNEQFYDYIIFDSPAGVDRTNLAINAFCDHRLVVVVPDNSSITDSYSIMKLLYLKHNIKENHLVINMASNYLQGEKIARKLADTSEHFFGGSALMFGVLDQVDKKGSEFDRVVKLADEEIFRSFYKSTKKFVEERLNGTNTFSSINQRASYEQYAHI